MTAFGRVLGVDVGSKRVGLARTDLLRITANSIGSFTPEDSFLEIKKQIEKEGPVIAAVVGWPLTPDGDPTHATHLAEEYINHLRNRYSGIDVYKMDERFSSKEAMRLMKESGVSRKKREEKGRLDQAAAALILQKFLEAHPDI